MEPTEEKVLTCEEIQATLKKDLENGQIIEDDQIINKFDRIIEGLIQGAEEQSKNAALELLKFIMENFTSVKVNMEVVKLLNNPNVGSEVYDTMMDMFKESLVKSIENQTFLVSDYIPAWKEESVLFVDIMENTAAKVDAKKLLLSNIIPELMQPTIESDIRNILLDIAFKFIPLVPISTLTPEEFRDLATKTAENYAKILIELRDKEYENWHNIWIFFIKFCERRLHSNTSLTNNLLRIVENAFRTSPSQRLKGYDCWLVLIDNASLTPDHFTSIKQMKLLMTPLKAKFSKQQEVIVKRYEVFVHLLEKLKYKATLCLTEFLEFCFGAVGPNSDPVKTGHGKSTPILWERIVVAFMEILGHSDGCAEKQFNFAPAFLTGANVGPYVNVIVKSVFECCAMMNTFDKDKRDKMSQCLWTTLFCLIEGTQEDLRDKIIETVCVVLKKLSEIDSMANRTVLWNFLNVVLNKDSSFIKSLFKKSMSIVAPFLLSEDMSTIIYDRQKIKDLITYTLDNDVNFRAVLDSFDNNLGSDNVNLTLACDLWLSFSKYIMLDVYSSNDYDFSSFMLWPLPIYGLISEDILKDIAKTWNSTYAKITEKSEKNKCDILDGVESLYDNDKLTRSGLMMLVEAVTKAETGYMPNIVPKILGIISSVLILPNLDPEQYSITKSAFFKFLDPTIEFYKGSKDVDISMICECLDQLLETHKDFTVLPLLVVLFEKIPPLIRLEFGKVLLEKMVDLVKKPEMDEKFSADLSKIIALLSEEVVIEETENLEDDEPLQRIKRTRSSDTKTESPTKKRRKSEDESPINGELPVQNGTETETVKVKKENGVEKKIVKKKRAMNELSFTDDLIQTTPRVRTFRTDLAQILRNEADERYNKCLKRDLVVEKPKPNDAAKTEKRRSKPKPKTPEVVVKTENEITTEEHEVASKKPKKKSIKTEIMETESGENSIAGTEDDETGSEEWGVEKKKKRSVSRNKKKLLTSIKSEDIIDSSQEDNVPITPRRRVSKTDSDPLSLKLTESEKFMNITLNSDKLSDEEGTPKRVTRSKTPVSKSMNLPTSPVTGDTPIKTDELIQNTSDLSPINTVPKLKNHEKALLALKAKRQRMLRRIGPKAPRWQRGIIPNPKTKRPRSDKSRDDLPESKKRKMFKRPIKPDPDQELSNLFDESANITTEDSLEITNALLLDDNNPIYPGLINCDDDIYNLVKILATPHFVNSWHRKLLQLGIKTVGDLALKTQSEVNRLPLKPPVVPKVLKALDDYFSGSQDAELLTQMEHIINQIKHKGDIGQVLYKTIGMEGLKTLINDLELEHVPNTKDKRIKDKIEALVKSIKDNNAEGLQMALKLVLRRKYFTKTEFFKKCVYPFIKVPHFLDPYFRTLTPTERNNFVVRHIRAENVGSLISCLRSTYGHLYVNKIFDKFRRTNTSTPEIKKELPESKIKVDANTEVLVDKFRKISAELPESVLFDLHIEFLNRVKAERDKSDD